MKAKSLTTKMPECNPTDVTNGFTSSPGHKKTQSGQRYMGCVAGFSLIFDGFTVQGMSRHFNYVHHGGCYGWSLCASYMLLNAPMLQEPLQILNSYPESVIFSSKSNWQPNLLMHPCRVTNAEHTMALSGNLQTSEDVSCQLLPASMMSFFKARYNPFLSSQGPSVSRCDPDWRSAEAEVFWKMRESVKAS